MKRMSIGIRNTSAVTGVSLLVFAMVLTGCLGVQLKKLAIRQLQEESLAIKDATDYLATGPKLGGAYEGRVIIHGKAFNEFLDGMKNYDVPIIWPSGPAHWPRKPVIRVEWMQLEFKDGPPTAIIQAKAMEASGTLEIKLRIRASLKLGVSKDKDHLEVQYAVQEILPDIRFSIFRWREFWFGMAILTLEADKHVKALPLTRIPLRPELAINVNPERGGRVWFNDRKGWVDVDQQLPRFGLTYDYRVVRTLTLEDGIHIFFTLERKE